VFCHFSFTLSFSVIVLCSASLSVFLLHFFPPSLPPSLPAPLLTHFLRTPEPSFLLSPIPPAKDILHGSDRPSVSAQTLRLIPTNSHPLLWEINPLKTELFYLSDKAWEGGGGIRESDEWRETDQRFMDSLPARPLSEMISSVDPRRAVHIRRVYFVAYLSRVLSTKERSSLKWCHRAEQSASSSSSCDAVPTGGFRWRLLEINTCWV